METVSGADDIREKMADILEALSVDNIPERYGFTEAMELLKNSINDDEYCCMDFHVTGYAFLKALLRTRYRLKRADPEHPLLHLISSSAEMLRIQLKLNEVYFCHLIRMDATSARAGIANVILLSLTAIMILALGGAVLAHA